MKKIIFSLAALFVGAVAVCAAPGDAGAGGGGGNFAAAHQKAFRHFCAMYGAGGAADGVVLADKTILFRFSEGGISYKAFFGRSGVWLHTVASYEGALLPAGVRSLVRGAYYDLRITYVDEVQTPGKPPVYQIQLQDAKTLAVVRVEDGEMEMEREWQK